MISRIIVFVAAHIFMVGAISGASIYSSNAKLTNDNTTLAVQID
jgi:uncharacterized membrane protein